MTDHPVDRPDGIRFPYDPRYKTAKWVWDKDIIEEDYAMLVVFMREHYPFLATLMEEDVGFQKHILAVEKIIEDDKKIQADSIPVEEPVSNTVMAKNIGGSHDGVKDPYESVLSMDKSSPEFNSELVKVLVHLIKEQRESYERQNLDVHQAHAKTLEAKDDTIDVVALQADRDKRSASLLKVLATLFFVSLSGAIGVIIALTIHSST